MPSETGLQTLLDELLASSKAEAIAVAVYDYEKEIGFSYHGDKWFHAASTIKVPVLVTLFGAVGEGRFSLDDRLHVRNRFLSASKGSTFKVTTGRDANSAVHRALGHTMKLRDLARHMIVTSSNLATNLLLDLIGLEYAQKNLSSLGITGIELKRGVEDERAFEAGINNRVTANGLLNLFRMIYERKGLNEKACEEMLDILHQQQFNSGIPAGLPSTARVAHKTGEISTVAHDTGLIFLEKRKPYALTILTAWPPEASNRSEVVSKISKYVYGFLQTDEDRKQLKRESEEATANQNETNREKEKAIS